MLTELCIFLGYASYYHHFIAHFSKKLAPLYALTEHVGFEWTDKCDISFVYLKKVCFNSSYVAGTKLESIIHIFSDASDTMIGVVLGQEEYKNTYTIYYIRKNLATAELNYTVTEKEFLVVIYVINKFLHYITGYPIFLYNDHSAIQYLANKLITNGRVT